MSFAAREFTKTYRFCKVRVYALFSTFKLDMRVPSKLDMKSAAWAYVWMIFRLKRWLIGTIFCFFWDFIFHLPVVRKQLLLDGLLRLSRVRSAHGYVRAGHLPDRLQLDRRLCSHFQSIQRRTHRGTPRLDKLSQQVGEWQQNAQQWFQSQSGFQVVVERKKKLPFRVVLVPSVDRNLRLDYDPTQTARPQIHPLWAQNHMLCVAARAVRLQSRAQTPSARLTCSCLFS
jgi:hypothetical protein